MENNKKDSNDAVDNHSKDKHVNISRIPSQKLDDDIDYKKSEGGKMPEGETDTDITRGSNIPDPKKERSQGNETMGNP